MKILDDRVRTANLDEDGLVELQLGLGKYFCQLLQNQTGIVDKKLMADCIKQSENDTLDEVEATKYILKEIWSRLRETHKLRIVK